jgi:ATP-dependent phosphoenolpyruvate carboxykinase
VRGLLANQSNILYPVKAWPSEASYLEKYRQLAIRFIDNFRRYESDSPEVRAAGPKVNLDRVRHDTT